MWPKGLIVLAVSLIIPLAAQAQGGGRTGGNAGISTGGNAGSSTARTTSDNNTYRSTQRAPIRQNVWAIDLSGRVVLSSGEAPTEPIRIKRVCGTQTTLEGYTDSKGRFSFRVGANASLAAMDASFGGPVLGDDGTLSSISVNPTGAVSVVGCTLEVDAPGYSSNSIALGRRERGDRPEVGTFILTPLGGTQAVLVSATSLAAPKKARSSFDKAVKELSKGRFSKPEKAIGDLEKAVTLYPEYAAAWAVLGQTRSQSGDTEGAVDALERALQADSRYLRPYGTLAQLMIAAGNWERTMELADFVLKVNPTNNQMLWFKAVSQFEMKSHDEAIASLIKLQSDEAGQKRYPQTHHVLGLIYADRGQFTEAASEYRRFLELSPNAQISNRVRRLLYEWEQLGIL
jgi:cytochrome c-type biogenesis protein CcmH/NrfG